MKSSDDNERNVIKLEKVRLDKLLLFVVILIDESQRATRDESYAR